MPIYEYRCSKCEKEIIYSHGVEETLTTCPDCNEETLKRSFTTIFSVQNKNDAGNITKEAIEEGRRELEEQKKQAKREH